MLKYRFIITFIFLLYSNSASSKWELLRDFEKEKDYYVLKYRNDEACRGKNYIIFPRIIEGIHEIKFQNKKVNYGSMEKDSIYSYYGAPIFDCFLFKNPIGLTWTVKSHISVFNNIPFIPYESDTKPIITGFFAHTMPIVYFSLLFAFGVFAFSIFRKKSNLDEIFYICFTSFMWASFQLFSIPGIFNLEIPIHLNQKIADVSLSLGYLSMAHLMWASNVLNKIFYYLVVVTISFSTTMILFSGSPDFMQEVINITFVVTVIVCLGAIYGLIRNLEFNRFKLVSITIFFIFTIHDVLVTFNIFEMPFLVGIGMIGFVIFYIASINESVNQTYDERDNLISNLEKMVKERTDKITNLHIEMTRREKFVAVGRIAGSIAHEIGTPLATCLDATDILESRIKKEKYDSLDPIISRIKRNLERIGSHSSDLREKTITERSVESKEQVEICSKFKEVVGDIDQTIVINTDLPEGCFIRIDSKDFVSIFQNLISNSIVHGFRDGEEKEVSLSLIKTDAERGALRFKDNGIGIKSEILNNIFDPYFTTTKKNSLNSGLGLSIIQNIVENKYRGTVKAVSSDKGFILDMGFPKEVLS